LEAKASLLCHRGVGIFAKRNTIMTVRKLLLAAASVAAMTPVISNASPESAAMNACAQAFASSLASGSVTPKFKLNYQRESGSMLSYYYASHDFAFHLQANDPKTGLTLARAMCSADVHGKILALTAAPLDKSPTLAAEF
jgi:hypothetical protein